MHRLPARRPVNSISTMLLAIVLLATLTTVSTVPRHARGTLSGKLVPADAALFGAYVKPTAWSQGAVKGALTRRENQIGRRFDVSHFFYPWGRAFPTWKENWDVEMGRIPLVAWGDVNTNDVNAGRHDNYIRARADAVKRFGAPIFIRWFSEMDTNYHSGKAISPSAYISAWRRIHRIFQNRGASNAVWVWCGTAAGFRYNRAQPFYPGATYVDWVCADGYNWAPRKQDEEWTSFAEIFRPFYNWGSTTGKPLMIAETGTEEDLTIGRKARWIADAASALKSQFRNIKAFVYFDAKSTDFTGQSFDWRTDTSASSLRAFAAMGRDPYFKWNRLYRPDAQIGGRKNLVGNDVYGSDQMVRQRLRRKRATRFTVRIENDGNIGDVYSVRRGPGGGKRLKVRYLVDGANVGPDVSSGSFLTPELEPGESMTMSILIRAKRGKIGKAVRLIVMSGSDKNAHDTVVAKVRRGKKRR